VASSRWAHYFHTCTAATAESSSVERAVAVPAATRFVRVGPASPPAPLIRTSLSAAGPASPYLQRKRRHKIPAVDEQEENRFVQKGYTQGG